MIGLRHKVRKGDFSLDVDLDIPDTGITGVFGESGSGKSLLGLSMMGMPPESSRTEGAVRIAGVADDLDRAPVHTGHGVAARSIDAVRGAGGFVVLDSMDGSIIATGDSATSNGSPS